MSHKLFLIPVRMIMTVQYVAVRGFISVSEAKTCLFSLCCCFLGQIRFRLEETRRKETSGSNVAIIHNKKIR